LLAARDSWSFGCAPRFYKVMIEKPTKIRVFLSEILLPIFQPKNRYFANHLAN